MATNVPSLKFLNGEKIPIIGLGTWKSKPGEVTKAVKVAIDTGYRHIDCALVYGNEKEVGEGINQKISEGTIKREDLFVTSKLWNTFHREDLVKVGIQKSLSNLGLSYLDLYLMHWPLAYEEEGDIFPKDKNNEFIFSDVSFIEAWKGMEKLVDEGLTRLIGVSNFNSQQINELLAVARIKPVTNQVECHPYLNQKKLKEFCESKGILITAYSPLGSPDRPWAMKDDPFLLEDPRILAIAEKYEKATAQIIIRYQIQRGVIVIPKSVTESRIISNFDVFDFTLSDEDMKAIDSLDSGKRFCHLSWVKHHKYYPFNIEY